MDNKPSSTKMNPHIAGMILVLALAYHLVAFYPYEWALPKHAMNGASWLSNGSLSFETPGIAFASNKWASDRDLTDGETVRVVLEVYSFGHNASQVGPARIISFSTNPYYRNLTIAQNRSDLVVRARRLNSNLDGMPDLVVPGVFTTQGWHRIETRILPKSVEIEVDGKTKLRQPNDPLAFELWDWSYPWMLGNERTGDRAWQGNIRSAEVCIDKSCVNFIRSQMLNVPDRYWIGNWKTLIDTTQLVSSPPVDIAINLLGFIPFGILMALLRKPIVTLRTVLISATTLSLGIEIGQILFQYRYTSLVDLFWNVTGALLGFAFARRVVRKDDSISI